MKTILKIKFATIIILASLACPLHAKILTGPVTNPANGHLYYVLSSTNFAAAEQEAVALGGHLATINDEAENQWVYTNFAAYASVALIIGLNDLEVKGTHRWVSGEESNYRNWPLGEPDNANGVEDIDAIWVTGVAAGKWNDFVNGKDVSVVEILPGIAAQMTIQPAVEVSWTTQTTNRYQVQWASSVNTSNWFNLGTEMQGTGSTNHVFDSTQGNDRKFYRVITLLP
jgi:hypothetical protein